MIGVSLPLKWLMSGEGLGVTPETVLAEMKNRGVKSVELRAVGPNTPPSEVVRIVRMLAEYGMQTTVHSGCGSADSAVREVFGPLEELLSSGIQKKLTVTLHPINGDNVAMLHNLADYCDEKGYDVTIALENNRRLPDKSEGDSAALVLDAVKTVNRKNVGICFDMGHYMYYVKKHRPDAPHLLPGQEFFSRVKHTHIHAVDERLETHFPLDTGELRLGEMLHALQYGYLGVYNIELDFPRFAGKREPLPALCGSVDTLRAAMPRLALIYDDIRQNFESRLRRAAAVWEKTEGTHFALIQSASYLFCTSGFRWAMDAAFRWAYDLAVTPAQVRVLLGGAELMIVSHEHADHFEKETVQALAKTGMKWLIPDFLLKQARAWEIPEENIILAHEGETVCVGPLTILPFRSQHFRPGGGAGVPEYGYHVSAPGEPSLVFPVDVRDFRTETLAELPKADYCFGNVWLGDENALSESCEPFTSQLARFLLHLSEKNLILTHLYENGRTETTMWRTEHGEMLSDAVHALHPETKVHIPRSGDILTLR